MGFGTCVRAKRKACGLTLEQLSERSRITPNYLGRIENDEGHSEQLKAAAKQWYQVLAFFETSGILVGMRMHAAADDALDIYSPRG